MIRRYQVLVAAHATWTSTTTSPREEPGRGAELSRRRTLRTGARAQGRLAGSDAAQWASTCLPHCKGRGVSSLQPCLEQRQVEALIYSISSDHHGC
jgi:hypothetical protein